MVNGDVSDKAIGELSGKVSGEGGGAINITSVFRTTPTVLQYTRDEITAYLQTKRTESLSLV